MRKILTADVLSRRRVAAATLMAVDGVAQPPPKRKILVALGTLCPGSVAKVVFDTIQGIPDYHFLIWVAPGQEQISTLSVRRCWQEFGGEWPKNFSFLTSSRDADMLAPEIKATFVHLFTDDAWFMPFSLERDIPIVTFSHSVSYFEEYPLLSNPRASKVVRQRRAYLLATKIVCWSNLEKRFISRFLPVVQEKIEVVALCQRMPDETYEPCPWPQEGPLKVLFAGRPLAKRKGFESLASALQQLVANGHAIELTVADAFTNAARLARSRFSRLLDGVEVKWLCDLHRERMRQMYQASHVVVVPSLYDSWCKVVTEAIAEGTPVIATDATGATEFFSRDEVPRVKAGDSKAIADAIEQLLANYPTFLAATQKARQKLKTELTLEKYAARLRQIIGLD